MTPPNLPFPDIPEIPKLPNVPGGIGNLPPIPKVPAVPNISTVIPSIPSVPKLPIPPIPPLIGKLIAKLGLANSLLELPSITIPKNPFSGLKSKIEAKLEGVEKFKEKQMLAINKSKRIKEGKKFLESAYTFETANSITDAKLAESLGKVKKDASEKISQTVMEQT